MRVFAFAFLTAGAFGGAAQAQTPMSMPEVIWCAGLFENVEVLYRKWQAEDARVSRMSVNRRNSDSVDRYNDQVSIVNWATDLYNEFDKDYLDKCGGKPVRLDDVSRLCAATILGKPMSESAYCTAMVAANEAEAGVQPAEFLLPAARREVQPGKIDNVAPEY